MIIGLFKLDADRRRIDELLNAREFQFFLEKLRQANRSALNDLYNCSQENLADRRGFARCLKELLEETCKKPGVTP
jgi:hypothetical protein